MSAAASFRDPAGSCLLVEGRAFRSVSPAAVPDLEDFLKSTSGRDLITRRNVVSTQPADVPAMRSLNAPEWLREPGAVLFEHERISFASYPHEWPPQMLHAAGALTLDIAQTLLPDGFGLKDATPYNVLFRGPKPIFVDVLSFERRKQADPIWRPYAQFVRTFLLPLLVNRFWGVRLAEIFTTHRDGLEPEHVYRWCTRLQRLRPLFLSLVSGPTWLARKSRDGNGDLYRESALADPARAQFIVRSTLSSLRRKLTALRPKPAQSSLWRDYIKSHSYSDASFAIKERFVTDALAEAKSRTVLDVGANTGHFSRLAAAAGASVIAIDSDPTCVGAIWQSAVDDKLDILPLVVDIGRPSPALGWRNRECPSFLDRARGHFDTVLMLALLHHLLVTERIPLPQIIELTAELTRDALIVEFIGREDPMFRQLTRGRDDLHQGLTTDRFEQAVQPHFRIVRKTRLPETARILYFLRNG
jgi:SAM-dependent methyltransferase